MLMAELQLPMLAIHCWDMQQSTAHIKITTPPKRSLLRLHLYPPATIWRTGPGAPYGAVAPGAGAA